MRLKFPLSPIKDERKKLRQTKILGYYYLNPLEVCRSYKIFTKATILKLSMIFFLFLGEIVVFCYPTEHQLRLYQQLLRCQLIRSCLAGRLSGSPHLICIGALKQLCNHPALLYQKAKKHEELAEETEVFDDGVSGIYE